MKKKLTKDFISTVLITMIFILFCGYAVIVNGMYSKLREDHKILLNQYEILESKINTCEQSNVILLDEKEQCSNKLADAESQLTKTTAELNNLKKN